MALSCSQKNYREIKLLKKIKLLTKEQKESYENAEICYICKEKFKNKYLKDKKHRRGKVTQPANIGPQDVPRTSPTNVPRTSPKGPI